MDNRTLVFIDGPSLFYSSKALNLNVDFSKLRDYFANKYTLIGLRYYNLVPNGEKTSVSRLTSHLMHNGYTCIVPGVDVSETEDGGRVFDGSVTDNILGDISLAALNSRLAHIVLLGHDSRYVPALQSLQLHGISTTLIGTRETDPPRVGSYLLSSATNFLELAALLENYDESVKDD
jgi:uncharacterized LabA/DUF88 family protein